MFNDLRDVKPDKTLTWFVTRWWLWTLVILLLMVIGAWVLGWITMPWQIISPENIRKQWTWGYDQYESLQAVAQQVCTAERAVNAATSDTERTQRQTQLIAYENNYARLAADYDARMRNAFEAGLVRPPDLPARAPTLQDMKLNACVQ